MTFFTTSSVFDSIDRALTSAGPIWTTDPRYYSYPGQHPTVSLDDWKQLFLEHGLNDHIDAFEKAKQVYKDLPAFPATDVKMHRESGSLEFDIALPGYNDEDISISFDGDNMLIEVARDNALATRPKKDDVIQFRKGLKSSGLTFKVPVPAAKFRVREAKASYKSGILNIVIPRNEENAPVKIKLSK